MVGESWGGALLFCLEVHRHRPASSRNTSTSTVLAANGQDSSVVGSVAGVGGICRMITSSLLG